MTSSKKKRMSLLDNLAAAGAQTPSPAPQSLAKNEAGSQMGTNRALRSARDAVDGHHVWELDPSSIEDTRPADRLDDNDVIDLRDAIEANGQTVPILVRRHPTLDGRYLLIYGGRRLEAIRQSQKVAKVRAIVANMDDDDALRAQLSENLARRDLSFIEKALLAQSLVQSGLGNQSQVAEILTVTKSSISMAISVVEVIGEDLIRAIGPAHGVGRPRWDALARSIVDTGADTQALIDIAYDTRDKMTIAVVSGKDFTEGTAEAVNNSDISVIVLKAVEKAVGVNKNPKPTKPPSPTRATPLIIAGTRHGAVKRTSKGLTLSLDDGEFTAWFEDQAQDFINELHTRWLSRDEK